MLPSWIGSSTPVTVTVCAVLQFTFVNVRLTGSTVPSVVSELDSAIVTSAVGWVSSTTVKVSVPSPSVVTSPAVGTTVMPAVSSSLVVAATSAASRVS